MFLNTLALSEKTVRRAVNKRTTEGVVLPDRRGKRYENLKEKDEVVRAAVLAHINKFPRTYLPLKCKEDVLLVQRRKPAAKMQLPYIP